MKRFTRSSAVLAVAAVAVGAAVTPAGATPAPAAPAPIARVASGPSIPAAERAAERAAEPLIPVWVTLGHGKPVAGAKVRFVGTDGEVAAVATTSRKGTAYIERSEAPESFSVKVTGGTVKGRPNGTVLLSRGIRRPSGAMRVVHVTPMTTIAAHVMAHRPELTSKQALRLTMRSHGFPSWIDQTHVGIVRGVFDHKALAGHVARHGSVHEALKHHGREIGGRNEVPSLSAVDATLASSAQRSARGGALEPRGLAATVGKDLMSGLVSGIASYGAEAALGLIFGDTDPTSAALSQISGQLKEINNELMVLQGQMENMVKAQSSTDYTVIQGRLSDVVQQTQMQWNSYGWFINHANPDSPDYRATMQSYAEDFQQYLQPYLPQFGNLFSAAGITGLLEQMYTTQRAQNPWWNQTDIVNMQSTVDFYGTLQAEATMLLTESWQFESPTYTGTRTLDYIDAQVTGILSPQNTDIYDSYPNDIGANDVVNYVSQRAYRLTPFTTPNSYVASYGTYDLVTDRYTTPTQCSDYKISSNYVTKTPTKVSAATVASWWQSVVPTGRTLSDNSEFSVLSRARSSGTTPAQVMKPASPNAELLVTAASVPWVSAANTAFNGWGWCGGSTVNISNPSKWVTNPSTSVSPNYQFQSKDMKKQWNVGVLTWEAGNFRYVAP